jgi:hypothetical protein
MPITVRVHRLAEPSLLAWARTLAADPPEAFALANLYFAALEQELARTAGRPERAYRVPRIEPETRVWDFQPGRHWVVYAIRQIRRSGWINRLLGRREWEIVILSFQDRAPTPADLERLTTARNRPV